MTVSLVNNFKLKDPKLRTALQDVILLASKYAIRGLTICNFRYCDIIVRVFGNFSDFN